MIFVLPTQTMNHIHLNSLYTVPSGPNPTKDVFPPGESIPPQWFRKREKKSQSLSKWILINSFYKALVNLLFWVGAVFHCDYISDFPKQFCLKNDNFLKP